QASLRRPLRGSARQRLIVRMKMVEACGRYRDPEGLGNRRQDDLAVSERYPQFAKIRLRKMREYPQIDITGGEDITILPEAKSTQPSIDVLAHAPARCFRCCLLIVLAPDQPWSACAPFAGNAPRPLPRFRIKQARTTFCSEYFGSSRWLSIGDRKST